MATGTSLALPYPTPTTSRSSPTTTSAVNEKRRPPLTTLATRLISTTRSWRSRPTGETVRSRIGIGRSEGSGSSEAQPALAGSFGKRPHAAVVLVAAAIEHGALDPGRPGALGQQLTGAARLLHRRQATELRLGPGDRSQRVPGAVVDQLREDAAVGAEHRDPWALGAAADLRAHAATATQAALVGAHHRHARLPTLRATYSPS